MTSAPQAYVRAADRPWAVWLRAGAWIALAAVLLALPFILMLSGPPPGGDDLTRTLALSLGFGALAMAGLQFALTGRIKPLVNPFGADIVVVFHRFLSWGAVAMMGAHFATFYLFHEADMGVINPFVAPLYMTAGRVALVCFGLLILTSEFRKMLGIEYFWWRTMHLTLALTGFGAAVFHVLGAGHFTGAEGMRTFWIIVTCGWVGLIVWTRLIRPWQQTRHPWKVIANEDAGAEVRHLTLAPQDRPLAGWRPGQFAWLSVGGSPFSLHEHPFTLSSAPEKGNHITFSIKPLGDDSAKLAETKPGATAYVDGPYGIFTVDRMAEAEGFVMIAAGVGITPILANLTALAERGDPRPVTLLYGNPDWDNVAFAETLNDLAGKLDLTIVHVLEDAPEKDPEGLPDMVFVEEGRIDRDRLKRHLPLATREWEHMLCGPMPMVHSLRAALVHMGVARRRIENEIFEMV